MIRKVDQLDLHGKRVFLRVDYNVPIQDGGITEPYRIDESLPTVRFVLERAKKTIIASHLGRPAGRRDPKFSLAPVRDYIEKALEQPVTLAPDCIGEEVQAIVEHGRENPILLENLRFHPEEEANDPAFSQSLAALADVYVNDAFGAAHRAHASTVGIAKIIRQKGAGFLMHKELDYLGRVLSNPEKPFIALLGGAKVSDKIAVVRNLLPKLDALLIGGGMAYTFLKAQGAEVGKSLLENDRIPVARDILAAARDRGVSVLLPVDHVVVKKDTHEKAMIVEKTIPPDYAGLDIGLKTVSQFSEAIQKARMVLWNGPMGVFEQKPFDSGTRAIAQALAESAATSIVAGGDSVAAIREAGVASKITHLSTGGGATLEFLEGKRLPGVQALEEDS